MFAIILEWIAHLQPRYFSYRQGIILKAKVFNRPGVAGPVLQAASSLINSASGPFPPNLQDIIKTKNLELETLNFERMFTSYHVSHVTCHISCVRCHVTDFVLLLFFRTKWLRKLMERLLSMGPTPSSFLTSKVFFLPRHVHVSGSLCLAHRHRAPQVAPISHGGLAGHIAQL